MRSAKPQYMVASILR